MTRIGSLDQLEALYGKPVPAATRKVASAITPDYRRFLERARFCLLATVGPEGTDISPRGDEGPVVRIESARVLALPDWRGNDRIDSLRNVVRDPRVSLLFLIPGARTVIRVNGRGAIFAGAETEAFSRDGNAPRSVLRVEVGEVYFQCARAILRSALWAGLPEVTDLPTRGQLLANLTCGEVGGADYDARWPERAAKTMW